MCIRFNTKHYKEKCFLIELNLLKRFFLAKCATIWHYLLIIRITTREESPNMVHLYKYFFI